MENIIKKIIILAYIPLCLFGITFWIEIIKDSIKEKIRRKKQGSIG